MVPVEDADGVFWYMESRRNERKHALIRAVLRRRFVHANAQRVCVYFFHRFFACTRFHADFEVHTERI